MRRSGFWISLATRLAKGQTGEICIYGGGVSLGYIGDHAEENSAFERQPDGSTMYRSGDLGDVSEASAIFEDTVDSDSEMRYEKYEATVSSEILDLGQTGVNGSGGWKGWR